MRPLLVAVLCVLACGAPPIEQPADAGHAADAGLTTELDAGEEEPIDPVDDAGMEEETFDAGQPVDAGIVVIETPDAGVIVRPPDHTPFRVMSYNLRGPLDTGAHAWPNRRAPLIALIKNADPDVIGVQEAMVTNGEDMPADLIAGLQTLWASYRPSGGSPKIIFYKKSRFTKLAQGTSNLPNPYATGNVCYDRTSGKKFSWVKLRDVASGKDYFIGNTHLAFSNECTAGRAAQAREIKNVITAQAGVLPVIVTGDFNTGDDNASLTDDNVSTIMEEEGTRLFRSARFEGNTTPDDATFNSRWNGSGTNTVRFDFIFNSGREITSSAPSIDRTPGTDTGTPSDHFPILATIRGATFEPGSAQVQIADGETATTQVFFADVNGDHCADAISWSSTFTTGATWWAKSRCDGTFDAPIQMGSATSGAVSTRFFFADVTGDGCAEKVFWRPTYMNGVFRVYRGHCDGSFDPVVDLTDLGSTSEDTRYTFARIDTDACADLVRWNPSGPISVFRSACDGTVNFAAPVSGPAFASAPWFADVDGDHKDDAITWSPTASSGRTRVARGAGNGTFAAAVEHEAGSSGVSTSRFFFSDLDGDGRADKVFWRPDFRNGRMQIYPASGTTFAGSPIMDNTAYSQSESTQFFFADVDGDGAADKAYWNPGANGGAAKVFLSRH